MSEEKVLKFSKIVVLVLFLISLGLLIHYESNVKGMYENNPETYEKHTETILSYMSDKGCVSPSSLSEHTNFSRLQARYLLSEMSKEKLVLKYPGKGICISFQARVQLALQ